MRYREISQPSKLFLDLDGVLADFERGVLLATGQRCEEMAAKSMWPMLQRFSDFYEGLPLMPDATVLWRFCKSFRPTILSGLPIGDWAAPQKRRWVANKLGANVPVVTCMTSEKSRYAHPSYVLVDDRASSAAAWESKGGIFIHHTSAESSIQKLKSLGFRK